MKRFFNLYQYLVPLLLFPVAYLLWLRRLQGRHDLVLLVLMIPVLCSYVIPGIGTNVTKLWKFTTKIRLGNFRPHHGFVFGTGMSLLNLLCLDPLPPAALGLYPLLRTGLITGTFTAFWNWVYDIYAIRAGFIEIYNRPWAAGEGPEAIAMDYAPMYFGLFGGLYAMESRLIEYYLLRLGRDDLYWYFCVGFCLLALTLPISLYMLLYYLRHGELGIWPHLPANDDRPAPRGVAAHAADQGLGGGR
jgi:hypothetical protein